MRDLNENRKVVGANLRKLREKADLSQNQTADAAGVRQETISKIESGSFNVSLDMLFRYCDAIGARIIFKK